MIDYLVVGVFAIPMLGLAAVAFAAAYGIYKEVRK